jgi:hypothetical protein
MLDYGKVIKYQRWDEETSLRQVVGFYCDAEGIDDRSIKHEIETRLTDLVNRYTVIYEGMCEGIPFISFDNVWQIDNYAHGEKFIYNLQGDYLDAQTFTELAFSYLSEV